MYSSIQETFVINLFITSTYVTLLCMIPMPYFYVLKLRHLSKLHTYVTHLCLIPKSHFYAWYLSHNCYMIPIVTFLCLLLFYTSMHNTYVTYLCTIPISYYNAWYVWHASIPAVYHTCMLNRYVTNNTYMIPIRNFYLWYQWFISISYLYGVLCSTTLVVELLDYFHIWNKLLDGWHQSNINLVVYFTCDDLLLIYNYIYFSN